jgi:hypothetical protein
MTTVHCLTGYDRTTDAQIFSAPIPADRFGSIKRVVRFNPHDPNGIFSYELSYDEAMEIASMIAHPVPPKRDLAFYLEACADDA